MNLMRLQLTIPGKHLASSGAKEESSGGEPDLVLDLRSRDEAAAYFGGVLGGSCRRSFEAFDCAAKGDAAFFYFSPLFLSDKLSELSGSVRCAGSPFKTVCGVKKEIVKSSERKDFPVFYALMRAEEAENVAGRNSAEDKLEELFKNCLPARILAAVLLSGIGDFFSLKEGGSTELAFFIKTANFSRLAAELYYLVEKNAGGHVPAELAACTGRYIRDLITEASDET